MNKYIANYIADVHNDETSNWDIIKLLSSGQNHAHYEMTSFNEVFKYDLYVYDNGVNFYTSLFPRFTPTYQGEFCNNVSEVLNVIEVLTTRIDANYQLVH